MSERMTASLMAMPASSQSTPLLDSRSSSSARACALAAEYSQRQGLLQLLERKHLQPLHTRGHLSSSAHASAGGSVTLSPLLGPLCTVLFLVTLSTTVDGERPGSRAICLQPSPLSRACSMAPRSALVSLK